MDKQENNDWFVVSEGRSHTPPVKEDKPPITLNPDWGYQDTIKVSYNGQLITLSKEYLLAMTEFNPPTRDTCSRGWNEKYSAALALLGGELKLMERAGSGVKWVVPLEERVRRITSELF